MIATDYFWLNIALLAVGTIAIRFSIISISGRIKISDRAKEIFSYVPAAILPALTVPMVFFHQGSVVWAQGKERALVLLLTVVVSIFVRNTLTTILFGLVALYVVRRL